MSPAFIPAAIPVRRYLAFVLAILVAGSMLAISAAAPARAASTSTVIDGLTYSAVPGDVAIVTDYDPDYGSEVVIAETVVINDARYDVTAIDVGVFWDHGLTSVILPDALASIGDYAFAYNKLTSVVLPDTVGALGDGVFLSNELASVTLPDGLVTIGYAAFADNEMTSVLLPDSLVTIGEAAFAHNQLTSVDLPDSVATLDDDAFAGNQLASVVLSAGLVTIGDGAFSDNQLTSVVIPAGVANVGRGAFLGNEDLVDVWFTGPAPTTITEAGASDPSLGTAERLVVTFPSQYLAQSPQEGYTSPVWLGYAVQPVFRVSFDSGGGTVIDPAAVSQGEVLEFPAAPTREGYVFTGWYTTPDLGRVFDAGSAVTEDLTLYAGWQPTGVPVLPADPGWISSAGGSLGPFTLLSSGS